LVKFGRLNLICFEIFCHFDFEFLNCFGRGAVSTCFLTVHEKLWFLRFSSE